MKQEDVYMMLSAWYVTWLEITTLLQEVVQLNLHALLLLLPKLRFGGVCCRKMDEGDEEVAVVGCWRDCGGGVDDEEEPP